MNLSDTFVMVSLILIWTVVRDVLLDKYWRYQRGNHLAEFGNLYVVMGCFVASFAIIFIAA
jgi:hypothetical protein